MAHSISMQDYVRTGIYCAAITQNASDFAGKTVMDVGAGSAILSMFAVRVSLSILNSVALSSSLA
jgi:predicted RNA methylase